MDFPSFFSYRPSWTFLSQLHFSHSNFTCSYTCQTSSPSLNNLKCTSKPRMCFFWSQCFQNNCLIWPYLFLQLFTIFSSIVFNAYILSEWWLIHRLVIYKFIHLVEISPMNSRHFDHHPTLHHQSDIQSKIRVEYQTHKISGFLLLRNSIILNV